LNVQNFRPATALENPMSTMSLNGPRHPRSAAGTRCLFARLTKLSVLASLAGLVSAHDAVAARACKPVLAVTRVAFTGMQPPYLERRWTATVSADASSCASTAGYFEMGFARQKENGMELEFREQFIWSVPAVTVGVDFWADEAVEAYWVDSIQSCPCASESVADRAR
jgi:hypothetical protein